MPFTRVRIDFHQLSVTHDSDIWGDGEFRLTASIRAVEADGEREIDVPGSGTELDVREGEVYDLLEHGFSVEIDVHEHVAGDELRVAFHVEELDPIRNDDLGSVTYLFCHPYHSTQRISRGQRAYSVEVSLTAVEVMATTDLVGPTSIPVSRQEDGSSTFTTIADPAWIPRIEVCPIVPVPEPPTRLPERPLQPPELEPGDITIEGMPTVLPMATLNEMVNPSVIPILARTDPELEDKAARLAVTYRAPGNLDLSFLTWHIVRGPVEFVGGSTGPIVKVNGTGNGADEMAEFEVRWDGAAGPVLATYRAWVGRVGRVLFRMNLLDGSNAASRASEVLNPADLDAHMEVARSLFWQAGLLFEPDIAEDPDDPEADHTPDSRTFEGAVATEFPGIYTVRVTSNNHTRNVNINLVPAATRYNFRPGVVNIAYVRSTLQGRAVASDIQGTTGNDENLDGSPSTSWVKPSGVPLDDAAAKVTMKTFKAGNRQKKKGPGDKGFINARHAADAAFTAETMRQLFACMVPSDWWPSENERSGINLAHELGHVLGLRHRGNGDSGHPLRSDDGVNSPDVNGKTRGHPWLENVMSYGYDSDDPTALSHDIDLIQAAVIRRHPAVTYD